jgi:hypothetical protein
VGTGRYADIYRAKGLTVAGADLSEDMLAIARTRIPDCRRASIFALPWPDQSFATAVCTRLVNWLTAADMTRVIAELRRVARTIVLSIRLDETERQFGTLTHAEGTFRAALDGLHLDARRVIREEGVQGVYTMVRLRPVTFADVVAQFDFDGHGGRDKLYRLADEWADRYGLPHEEYSSCPVRAEWWPRDRLAAALEAMATVEPRLVLAHGAAAPRQADRPITILRWPDGRLGQIDGRHRVAQWTKRDSVYPVLMIECSSS